MTATSTANTLLGDVFAGQDRERTCIVDGHGISINVEKGHLLVKDGIGTHRRTRRYNRATAQIDRVVVLAATGTVTLTAQRWLADLGITYLQLAADGTAINTSGILGSDNPGLRRAQALATGTPTGTDITRTLLQAKVAGQRAVLADKLDADLVTLEAFDEEVRGLTAADSPKEFMFAESRAAVIYWQAWRNVPLRFASRDAGKIPDHWRTVGRRQSPRSGKSPRNAINPANAILNYLYRLLEAQTRLATLRVGLDPGIGILHADRPARDSLVLDLIEPARQVVDGWALELFERRTFAAADFTETADGTCRINPPLTHTLAETLPKWAEPIGPHVETLAKSLHKSARTVTRVPATPLTGANNARRHPNPIPQKVQKVRGIPPERTCKACGTPLGRNTEHLHCKQCQPREHARQTRAWSNAGVRAQAESAAAGLDPRQTHKAKQKRAEANSKRHRQRADWNPTERPDPAMWTDVILPGIQHFTTTELARATGLSTAWCSLFKRGRKVPHPMHWNTLADLVAPPFLETSPSSRLLSE